VGASWMRERLDQLRVSRSPIGDERARFMPAELAPQKVPLAGCGSAVR